MVPVLVWWSDVTFKAGKGQVPGHCIVSIVLYRSYHSKTRTVNVKRSQKFLGRATARLVVGRKVQVSSKRGPVGHPSTYCVLCTWCCVLHTCAASGSCLKVILMGVVRLTGGRNVSTCKYFCSFYDHSYFFMYFRLATCPFACVAACPYRFSFGSCQPPWCCAMRSTW